MALVFRNGRPRLQRSVRRNGRATSEYVASGESALLIDQMQAIDRDEKDYERWSERTDREALESSEAPFIAYCDLVERLAHAALRAAGFHQHKRQWRKRRVRRD